MSIETIHLHTRLTFSGRLLAAAIWWIGKADVLEAKIHSGEMCCVDSQTWRVKGENIKILQIVFENHFSSKFYSCKSYQTKAKVMKNI